MAEQIIIMCNRTWYRQRPMARNRVEGNVLRGRNHMGWNRSFEGVYLYW